MIHNFTDVIAFIIAICVLVAVHEFGHFYIARRCGVKVLRFSIGMGPVFARWTDKLGTEFALSAIPIGGYVMMYGDKDEDVAPEDVHLTYNGKPNYQRIAIAAAGPIANFILALFLYWIIFLQGTVAYKPVIGEVLEGSIVEKAGLESGQEIVSVDGVPTHTQRDVLLELMNRLGESGSIQFAVKYSDSDFVYESQGQLDDWLKGIRAPDPIKGIGLSFFVPPVSLHIAEVQPNSAAQSAGLLADDLLVKVDGEELRDGEAWIEYVRQHPQQAIELEVDRKGQTETLTLIPSKRTLESGEEIGFAGVSLPREPWPKEMQTVQDYGVLGSLLEAGKNCWETAGMSLMTMRKLIFGEISVKNLSGPIGIAKVAGDSGRAGMHSFIQFLAYMSILLGVINLMPVPVLDGGRILYHVIEWVKGSPIPEKIQTLGNQAGVAVILGVMVLAFYNDILL